MEKVSRVLIEGKINFGSLLIYKVSYSGRTPLPSTNSEETSLADDALLRKGLVVTLRRSLHRENEILRLVRIHQESRSVHDARNFDALCQTRPIIPRCVYYGGWY